MQTQPVIEGWRGMAVRMGLQEPIVRGVTASIAVGTALYLAKLPASAFRANGETKPYYRLSTAADATSKHVLLIPLAVGAGAFLCT